MSIQNLFICALPLFTLLFTIGCQTMGPQVMNELQDANGEIGKAGEVVISSAADEWGTDPYTINAATVKDGTLTVNVSYNGGNRETHAFTLVAEPMFMESFPVQLRVSLAHDANGDTGTDAITEDYRFDLTSIKAVYQESYQATAGTIVLRLKDAPPGDLFYDF